MTEDELRAICVQFMAMQQSVLWTPDRTFVYSCPKASTADENGNLTLYQGVRYAGTPYGGGARDLNAFLDFYNEETGLLNVSERGDDIYLSLSNTCSTAAYWGWARVSSTQNLKGVAYFNPAYGYYPVGPYVYDTDAVTEFTGENVTGEICAANGEQVMYESYACVKPASGLVTKADGSTGHIRMVSSWPVVVRKADGTIDGSKSYLTVNEQDSAQTAVSTPDGVAREIGNVNRKYTFQQLFKSKYLPFEIAELSGRATVQTAEAGLKNGSASIGELLFDAVSANYAISRVKAVFTDAGGQAVYEPVAYGSAYNDNHNMNVSQIFTDDDLRGNLQAGAAYTLTFEVRLGNGETKTVEFGAFVYE